MIRQFKDPKYYRHDLVRFAQRNGVKAAARKYSTTPKTVRKWLKRWVPGSLDGLDEHSRAPKNPKTYITEEHKSQAIELKKKLPSFGSERIKDLYHLPISEKAIRKIWKNAGLLKVKRRKHKTKHDLRTIKKLWRLFEQISMDTKDLIDIPEYWLQMTSLKLPKVQYTAREVVSGNQYIAFANERAVCYAALFAHIILNHLKLCRIDLKNSRTQTDNGCEFIGSWNATQDSLFTRTVQSFPGVLHTRIPPAAHTWQADVETVHRLIEDEFYETETFKNRQDFLCKATAYIYWFNIARKNRYKNKKTPWEIIRERKPNADPRIPLLPPVFLDELYRKNNYLLPQGGDNVVPDP